MYRKDSAVEAWRTFVGTGKVLEGKVRPEIARSWVRCRAAGVNPWSSDFAEQNVELLKEKRARFSSSLEATRPVMKFLVALLGCNVSLMDGENFVFELLSPMGAYPRTFGTFMREEDVGTGNATIVAYERKPVRVDGFEHYRAIAQNYSGVSVPYLDEAGKYYGAMNLNNPFEALPSNAESICQSAVELSNDLFRAGKKSRALLSTIDFFNPVLLLFRNPVIAVDAEGHILGGNAAARTFCSGWEQSPYGSQALDSYLGKGTTTRQLVSLSAEGDLPKKVRFKKGRSKSSTELTLLRNRCVDLDGQESFYLLVFSDGAQAGKSEGSPVKRRNVAAMPSGKAKDYVGESPEWKAVDEVVQRVAPIRTNILLLGETGSGKEVVARALHRRSGRKGEFVAVNCGALPRDLLATELFGYEGGAFTGARESGAVGKFEYADGGTLFLDEIGEMPVDMQVSLLRVLQEMTVTKLGSNDSKALDLRVIAATNQDISKLIEEKKFRSDLYYRLSMVEIKLPPLRRRPSDVPLLVDYFNRKLSQVLAVPYSAFPKETIAVFESYSWPGNVRELRNLVERSLIMQGEGAHVTVDSLPPHVRNASNIMAEGLEPILALGTASEPMTCDSAVNEEDSRLAREAKIAALRKDLAACGGDLEELRRKRGLSYSELGLMLRDLGLRVRAVLEDASVAER